MTMKIKRNKEIRKTLRFYKTCFALREPYHVLIDLSFIEAALQGKIMIKDQLPVMLGARVTPMVTDCILREIAKGGSKMSGPDAVAKSFYRVRCGHAKSTVPCECLKLQVGATNEKRMFVATQDRALQNELGKVGGVPILFISGHVPMLEPPSETSKSKAAQKEDRVIRVQDWERKSLGIEEIEEKSEKPKKTKKNPNPLSVQKKIMKPVAISSATDTKRTRRKKKVKASD